ncbi:hypothetical protein ASF60_00380 [Methylobacterium sp. Leaf113]|uniref:hypothetical protein n=1 Tax=Methylobacterium sp. Leaf113 TaxID=1736259 RepID=UPI0006F40574|nr:hypothetical protein [Methylobacterium sp. Leaf113]KQP94709.1 hypothetical protein ASF60_00380 [Methylobacterium sp. Leaf113]
MRCGRLGGSRVATLVVILGAGPSLAAERQPFEMVKGWEIERTIGDTSPHACLMSHTYQDKDDGNAVNGIIFALGETEAALGLVYENWTWDKQESVKVPFFLDKTRYDAEARWIGDGQSLTATFPTSIVPRLMAAQTIILKFDNGNADFEIGGFAEGYESLRRCNAAKAEIAKVETPKGEAPKVEAPKVEAPKIEAPKGGAAVAAAPVAAPPAPAPAPAAPAPAALASAGRYEITTIGEGADFTGCMALNEPAGLALVAVGPSLGLIATSAKFPFPKGSAVAGAWTVDGAGATDFAAKIDTARTVSIDVPNTVEAVTRLTAGKSLVIQANGIAVPFALGPMQQAFTDLSTCMGTKKAP